MLGTTIGIAAIVGVIAFAVCAVDRDEQTRATHDVRDERIDALPPDPNDGLTWDPRHDEEPRPGTGPRRREVEL